MKETSVGGTWEPLWMALMTTDPEGGGGLRECQEHYETKPNGIRSKLYLSVKYIKGYKLLALSLG